MGARERLPINDDRLGARSTCSRTRVLASARFFRPTYFRLYPRAAVIRVPMALGIPADGGEHARTDAVILRPAGRPGGNRGHCGGRSGTRFRYPPLAGEPTRTPRFREAGARTIVIEPPSLTGSRPRRRTVPRQAAIGGVRRRAQPGRRPASRTRPSLSREDVPGDSARRDLELLGNRLAGRSPGRFRGALVHPPTSEGPRPRRRCGHSGRIPLRVHPSLSSRLT
jgi:hypothetical protein